MEGKTHSGSTFEADKAKEQHVFELNARSDISLCIFCGIMVEIFGEILPFNGRKNRFISLNGKIDGN